MSALLAALIGKGLWTCRRAGDMATFQFGTRNAVYDYYGRPAEIGEFALHVQCAWRIVRDDAVVVGSRDLFYPPGTAGSYDAGATGFDWDHNVNRRDVLLQALFENGRRELVVRGFALEANGTCYIDFDDDFRLEVFVDDSLPHEHWRLFAADSEATLVR